MSNAEFGSLPETLANLGQMHLLDHESRIDAALRDEFRRQLESIDWAQFRGLKSLLFEKAAAAPTEIKPASAVKKGKSPRDAEANRRGVELLRSGRVAAFVVAGGQGSRLGYDGPKGIYPATPITKKSLFQVFAEKIRATNAKYSTNVPWYIMTSTSNHDATIAWFKEKNFCGLAEQDVFFLTQDMVPAVDESGKVIVEEPGRIFLSPNGHGGSLWALRKSGALDDMTKRGIEEVFYFQVDNPLVEIADPIFLGHHSLARAEMSSKVLPKRDPDEKVGVVAKIDGKYGVIEYSDLAPDLRYARRPDGELLFNDGSIAIHFLRRDFIASVTNGELALPFHLAKKSIPSIDPATFEKRSVKGVKFETFVFDALAFTKNSVVLQVDRADEFAPIKNATGEDSPETSSAAQTAMFARWIESAGGTIARSPDGRVNFSIEISPLYSIDAEGLKRRDIAGRTFESDTYLG